MSSQTRADGVVDEAVEVTYREAIRLAFDDELASDPSVVLLGEDIAAAGGPFKTTEGLYEKYGGDRLIDTPIAENGFCGMALGMAMTGMRPVVEIMFSDFLPTAYDAIAMEMPRLRFMSGGQTSAPVTVRASGGGGGRFGAQTSSTGESWFLQFLGLQIAVSGSPQSAYGLLRTAIQENNPVVVFEHKALHGVKGPLVRGDTSLPEIGQAEILREGSDVTVVGSLLMVHRALEASEALAAKGEGIDAEVIDIRWVRPLDLSTIRQSLEKTGRLVVLEEQYHEGGWGSAVVSRLTEAGFSWQNPPTLVSMPDVLISHSPPLEDLMVPSVERIESAIRATASS